MKRFFYLCIAVFFVTVSFAQQRFNNFHFSGYKVIVIPSEVFAIDIKNPTLSLKKISGKSFRLEIIDQKGRMPKDTVIIYTNRMDVIYLHNSQLVFKGNLVTDSIRISATSSFGEIDISSKKLSINLSAGSRFKAKGKTDNLNCNIKAASTLDSRKLNSDKAELCVKNGSLTVNTKEIIHLEKDNESSFFNAYGKE